MSHPTPLLRTGLVSRTRPMSDPGDLLHHLGPGGFAWFRPGLELATSGVAARVPVNPGPHRVRRAAQAVAALLARIETDDPLGLPGSGPLAVGALPFDDRPGELTVPAVVVGRRMPDGTCWITETGPASGEPARGPRLPPQVPTRFSVTATRPRAEWLAAVERALAAIAAGTVEKVVLAREVIVEADRAFDLGATLARLRDDHPSCFVFAAGLLVGATPELLVERRGDRVRSCPVAGTAPPHAVDRLRASAKEQAEHGAVVRAVASALAPLSDELTVPSQPGVMGLAHASHLVTPVTGRLRPPAPGALELAGHLHPTPAVAGTPTGAALSLIRELEQLDRGCYAGPVGWVDARGDGEWAVALRCAEVEGSRARLFAGAGLVGGSDPEAEWDETQRKLEAMLVALVCP